MILKIIRAAALIALVISLFFTVDYGINLLGVLVPELNTDGFPYYSVLQRWFGMLHLVNRHGSALVSLWRMRCLPLPHGFGKIKSWDLQHCFEGWKIAFIISGRFMYL